jgi:hypothetical protein
MLLAMVTPQASEGFAQPSTRLALQSLTASLVYLLHALASDDGDEMRSQAHRNIVGSLAKRVAMGQIIYVPEDDDEENTRGSESGSRTAFLEGILKVALNGTRSIKEFVFTNFIDVRKHYAPPFERCPNYLFDSNTGSLLIRSLPRPIHV